MPIKRNSCRITERTRMRNMAAEGYSIQQISNAVSVHEHIVDEVLSGRWAEAEAVQAQEQRTLDEKREVERSTEKEREAAAMGAAIAAALKPSTEVAQEVNDVEHSEQHED